MGTSIEVPHVFFSFYLKAIQLHVVHKGKRFEWLSNVTLLPQLTHVYVPAPGFSPVRCI